MVGIMPIDRSKLASDYSLVITSRDRLKGPWGWKIQRKSKPLGIKTYSADFNSENAARIVGEKALREFIDRLCHEENGAS
jgi:hypothetical protein